jgi:AraC-like DNA-binding protein
LADLTPDGEQLSDVGPVRFDSVHSSIRFICAIDQQAASSSADIYMQFAVYDLVGALFAPSDPRPVSRSADKLFARICGVVKDGLLDPDFGPAEVASEAGISLRYVQKPFTERSTTCSEFIYSHRLDHAAHLLHRRALTGTGQPLSEIAYACGGLAIRRALTRERALWN